MKLLKVLSFLLFILTIAYLFSPVDIRANDDYNKLVETFEMIDADFKFYNIKSTAKIDYDITKDEMKDIFIDIINNSGLEEENIVWEEKWDIDEKKIYVEVKNQEKNSISIVGIKKNTKESYIIVDILENKVYKNIVDIYTNINNTLTQNMSNVDNNICIVGQYSSEIDSKKYNDILSKILYNMKAEEIDRVEYDNFISTTAYSDIINDNDLEYLDQKINLNVGMRYSEEDEKTLIYIATPIIKIDY